MMQRQQSTSSSDSDYLNNHRCLRGLLHLTHGMRILTAIGLVVIAALLVFEALYFRRAIFILAIPTLVSLATLWSTISLNRNWVWPIIGVSFFHIFIALYVTLIFLYFFFFKPFYIIMVLNWAFDTLHTQKTPSYYIQCGGIMAFLILFIAYNYWQLVVSLDYFKYLNALQTEVQSRNTSRTMASEKSQNSPIVLVVNRNPSDVSAHHDAPHYRMDM